MTESERNQIKPQLLKCARENENKSTFTGYVIISAVCRAAVERIEELEQENAQLSAYHEKQKEINKELVDDIAALQDELRTAKEHILEANKAYDALAAQIRQANEREAQDIRARFPC